MVKPACFDSNGMKKGAWSEDEDNKLRAYIERYGHWNWRLVPKYAGLARCGKSCRLRWVNYLKPGVKRGKFSKQEVGLIIQLHRELGNKWSAIAEKLPGRTDNDIKNYWHAYIKKHTNMISNKLSTYKFSSTQISNQDSMNALDHEVSCVKNIEANSCASFPENELSFWNDPALADIANSEIEHYFPTITTEREHQLHYTELSSSNSCGFSPALEWNIVDGDHGIISSDSLTQSELEQGSFWNEPFYLEADFQGDDVISYSTHLAAQEEGRYYDLCFIDFDHSMSLF